MPSKQAKSPVIVVRIPMPTLLRRELDWQAARRGVSWHDVLNDVLQRTLRIERCMPGGKARIPRQSGGRD
jgi:hypothetical protein